MQKIEMNQIRIAWEARFSHIRDDIYEQEWTRAMMYTDLITARRAIDMLVEEHTGRYAPRLHDFERYLKYAKRGHAVKNELIGCEWCSGSGTISMGAWKDEEEKDRIYVDNITEDMHIYTFPCCCKLGNAKIGKLHIKQIDINKAHAIYERIDNLRAAGLQIYAHEYVHNRVRISGNGKRLTTLLYYMPRPLYLNPQGVLGYEYKGRIG